MSGSLALGGLTSVIVSGRDGHVRGGGLLSALYGTPGNAASTTNPVTALRSAEANSTKDIAQTAKQPAIARDIATFRSAVASATSPQQLLQNPTVLKVLLTANGLGDQAQYPALAQKALLSDTTKTTALANTLANTAWKTTASLYDFANQGLAVLQKPGVMDTLANGYAEVTWRQSLDQTTPGLSEALTSRPRHRPSNRWTRSWGTPPCAPWSRRRSAFPSRSPSKPRRAGEGDQLQAGHHQVPGPEVRRDIHHAAIWSPRRQTRARHLVIEPGPARRIGKRPRRLITSRTA